MLSGIGPASELKALGINPVADLKGVGGNLQEPLVAVFPGSLEQYPGPEDIGPGLDCIFVVARFGRDERRGPAVVAMRLHGRAKPLARRCRPPQQFGREHRIAVPNDVGPDAEGFAGDAFDHEAAAVDARIDVLNDDAPPGTDVD